MKIKTFLFAAVLLGTMLAGLLAPPAARAAGREVPPDALRCLALAVYFEAGGEPQAGKQAVAHVVLNRAQHAGFPGGVCSVVQQGGGQRQCQFGWYCDGRSDQPTSARMWQSAQDVAREVLAGQVDDPTGGALYFAPVRAKRPAWTQHLTQIARIGGHVFYR
jgi:spore germination cell wall hydrolase CwlJ-like protein